MKKSCRKLFLIMAVVITAIVCFAFEAGALEATGRCGDNITWEYDSIKRELILSGTGSMYSYSKNHRSPFCDNSFFGNSKDRKRNNKYSEQYI